MSGGETSLTGYDNASQVLSYTPGQEQVYLNGILLVRGDDYTATNGTSITGLTALAASDFVQVNCYNNFSVATLPTSGLVGTISNDQLQNSSITINGSAISLGGSVSLPGDIESVTAGTGLTGGGTSGAITLSVDTSTIQSRVANVSDTEIGYLDGVTSAIQTQLNNKQAVVSGVSDTEIGYLDGVTSNIQTQLGSKLDKLITRTTQTGTSYTLVSGDAATMVTLTNAGSITLTVPTNSNVPYSVGTQINLLQGGAGQVTVQGDTGVTVVATPGLKLRAQWSAGTLIKLTTDSWLLVGDLSA